MRSPLVPCPGCSRHVFASDAACPFCAVALPPDLARHAVPAATRRLTRAAAFAFTTSLSVAACSSGGSGTIGDAGGGGDSAIDSGGGAPAYGQPAFDGGGPAPLYGMPADAGAPDADAGDGSHDSGGGAVLYGLPPPDAAGD